MIANWSEFYRLLMDYGYGDFLHSFLVAAGMYVLLFVALQYS